MQAQREELTQRVLQAMAQLPQLEMLTLGDSSANCSLVSLRALLPTLREIEFHCTRSWGCFSAADVRAEPDLKRVAAHVHMGSNFLSNALRMPHELQWQSLGPLMLLEDGVADLLSRLPTQTSLASLNVLQPAPLHCISSHPSPCRLPAPHQQLCTPTMLRLCQLLPLDDRCTDMRRRASSHFCI